MADKKKEQAQETKRVFSNENCEELSEHYPYANRIRRIGVSTSGGDCPGLNAVIRAVTKVALNKFRWEVLGILNGLQGLVDTHYTVPLTLESVRGILSKGGTILGAASHGNPFERKVIINGKIHKEDLRPIMKENFDYLGLDALIMIGGEGTMAIANELGKIGIPIVGVPKTIDNDLIVTDYTFGYQTAVMTAMDAIDRLQDTAASHHRIMILEVMGRYSGWIALAAGIAGDADVILIPEIPYDLNYVSDAIIRRKKRGKNFSIVVVAEGAREKGKDYSIKEKAEERGSDMHRLGGAGEYLAHRLKELTGLETRVTVLGHIQRGGSPIAFDRILATKLGIKAVELVGQGKFGRIACLRGNEISDAPITDAIKNPKMIPPDSDDIKYAEMIGINFGRENKHYIY
jgi:6-phosphofructokinase 1